MIPFKLLNLDGGCGVVSAWMALHNFKKKVPLQKLIRMCDYSSDYGTYTICIAVALKELGLDVSFHTDEDNDKTAVELKAYRRARDLLIPVLPAFSVIDLHNALDANKYVIVLYDTPESVGHFSPVSAIDEGAIKLAYADEPILPISEFNASWRAEGICQQSIIVG